MVQLAYYLTSRMNLLWPRPLARALAGRLSRLWGRAARAREAMFITGMNDEREWVYIINYIISLCMCNKNKF